MTTTMPSRSPTPPTPDPHRTFWAGAFSGLGAVAVAWVAWTWLDHYRLSVPRPVDFLGGVACFTLAGFLLGRHSRQ